MFKVFTNDEAIYYFTKFHFGAKEIRKKLEKMDKNDERYEGLRQQMLAYEEEASNLLGGES